MSHDHPRRQLDKAYEGAGLRSSAAAFLAAERTEDEAAADAALYRFFRHLPSPAPAADFAARVLARTRIRPAADLARPARAWVTAAILATGLAIAILWPVAHLAALRIDWIGAFAGSVVALAGWLGGWIVALFTAFDEIVLFGRAASVVGRAFHLVAASPQVLLALTLISAVTAFLLRVLAQLVHTPSKVPTKVPRNIYVPS